MAASLQNKESKYALALKKMADNLEKVSKIWADLSRAAKTAKKNAVCSHQFAIDDLVFVNRDSTGNDRVSWVCDKCGKVFMGHCGLDISPENGPTFRRGKPYNAALTGAEGVRVEGTVMHLEVK